MSPEANVSTQKLQKVKKKQPDANASTQKASNKRQKVSNKRQKVSNKIKKKVKKNKKGQRHKNRNFVYHEHHGQCGYEKTVFCFSSVSQSTNTNKYLICPPEIVCADSDFQYPRFQKPQKTLVFNVFRRPTK